MSNVAILPTERALSDAWERYRELVLAMDDDPALKLDRAHINAMLAAHREYALLFKSWLDRQ